MSTSKQTITQVRDILRKLDRSIEDARERRTTRPMGPEQRAGAFGGAAPPNLNGRQAG